MLVISPNCSTPMTRPPPDTTKTLLLGLTWSPIRAPAGYRVYLWINILAVSEGRAGHWVRAIRSISRVAMPATVPLCQGTRPAPYVEGIGSPDLVF
jgi:hypothetical protein